MLVMFPFFISKLDLDIIEVPAEMASVTVMVIFSILLIFSTWAPLEF